MWVVAVLVQVPAESLIGLLIELGDFGLLHRAVILSVGCSSDAVFLVVFSLLRLVCIWPRWGGLPVSASHVQIVDQFIAVWLDCWSVLTLMAHSLLSFVGITAFFLMIVTRFEVVPVVMGN